MTSQQILIDAKALIDTPEKWCRGAYRNLQNGVMQRCASGAVSHAGISSSPQDVERARRLLLKAALVRTVSHFNDTNPEGHAGVMALFDRAIEMAERQSA